MTMEIMWNKWQKVQSFGQSLADRPISIMCKAVYVCMLMDSCVHTLHSIPCTGLLLLAIGSSDLCAKYCWLESQSQVDFVNGFIGLSNPKPSFLDCKGLYSIINTPLPTESWWEKDWKVLRIDVIHAWTIRSPEGGPLQGWATFLVMLQWVLLSDLDKEDLEGWRITSAPRYLAWPVSTATNNKLHLSPNGWKE